MGSLKLPAIPETLKTIQHYLNVASEHEGRDLIVTYWCRLYALQTAMKLDKSSDSAKLVLLQLMDWLEIEKKNHRDNEFIVNDTAAQAYIENYALKLFQWADGMDRSGEFNKSIVKAFYTSGILMEVLQTFGELSEDLQQNKKYAKWKAAYINNCIKNGEIPVPGPPSSEEGPSPSSNLLQNQGQEQSQIGFGYPPNQTEGFSGMPTPSGYSSQPTNFPSQPTSPTGPSQPYPPTDPGIQPFVQPNIPQIPTPTNNIPSPTSSSGNIPSPTTSSISIPPQSDNNGDTASYIAADKVQKCQKYIKFAGSALNYDDYKEAKSNLLKALHILNTGQDV